MQVKKQPLQSDMEQWTGSKLGKAFTKAVYFHPAYLTSMQAVYFHPAYLTSMQSTSCEMPG